MELKVDLSKEYGIVLEGGGAKGAYQVGAWKALLEAGIRIKGIAGASVGALNGALMCMDDLKAAEKIWKEIAYSRVMDVDDGMMEQIKKGIWKGLDMKELASNVYRVLKDGGFDISPLRGLIEETVDETRIRESDRDLYVTTFSLDEFKQMSVDVKTLPEGHIGDALLASAYFMAFKNEKLMGKRFMDGGSVNNVPLDVLVEHGYRDIIVIRIYGLGYDTERNFQIPDDVTVSHIAPRQDLGGILEFDKRRARKNMTLGYYDAKRFLYGLSGRVYYLDAPRTEAYYFDKMMTEMELILHYTAPEGAPDNPAPGYRFFTEQIFPEMAGRLKLKEGWDYKDLYLALLEERARELKIKRFCIYTPDELIRMIRKKAGT